MNFSKFFIDRPIFAAVLSIVIFAAGLLAIPQLSISEYPEVVPPTVQVRAVYPGANPKVIAETVATPLEEAINGVEHMMYMKSIAGSDGVLVTTVTFAPGTDPDQAQVQVQNRVNQALARLPDDVRRQGVTTQKQSPNLTMVVHLLSPSGKYDSLYLRNYATLKVKDELRALARASVMPVVIRFRRLRDARLARSEQGRCARIDCWRCGRRHPRAERAGLRRPARCRADTRQARGFPAVDQRAQGRLRVGGGVRRHRASRPATTGEIRASCPETSRASKLGAGDLHAALAASTTSKRSESAIFQSPGANALEVSRTPFARRMDELSKIAFPKGIELRGSVLTIRRCSCAIRSTCRGRRHAVQEAVTLLVVIVVILFLQTWRASVIPLLAVPISIIGTFGVLLLLGFTINTLTLFGLVLAIGIVVDDAIVVVENVERRTSGCRALSPACRCPPGNA